MQTILGHKERSGISPGYQSDGAARENARYRIGDAARKDTACQFGYFVRRYCRGIALVLAAQSVRYRSLSFPNSTPDGAEDRASLKAAVGETGRRAAAIA